jgi:ABC-2 type transport system permease protein
MLRKFGVLLRVTWSGALAYRAELLLWALTGVLPLVMLAVWRTLAGEGGLRRYSAVAA